MTMKFKCDFVKGFVNNGTSMIVSLHDLLTEWNTNDFLNKEDVKKLKNLKVDQSLKIETGAEGSLTSQIFTKIN
jgi:hypothetical protein